MTNDQTKPSIQRGRDLYDRHHRSARDAAELRALAETIATAILEDRKRQQESSDNGDA